MAAMLMLFGLSGCGYIDYFLLPPPEDTAQELYEAGAEAMQEKDYLQAAERFQQLKDRYPFSPYAARAEIGLGDAYYLAEMYVAASDAYIEFEALHPRHENIQYVLFQVGMANYSSATAIDKPMDRINTAIEYFRRIIEEYPDGQYAAQAAEYIVHCRRKLAEHEVFVADFYWKLERYGAAWERYRFVVENYTDLPDVVAYAEQRATVAYLRQQESNSEEQRETEQGSWKKWLDWL
jgi:outer membrane protein assembly factor BamD